MTRIKLHGLIAEEFGEVFNMHIGNPSMVIDAIDANRSGFKKRIIELHKSGFNYTVIVDKKRLESKEEIMAANDPDKIDLVPVLSGSGPAAPFIITFIVSTVLSLVLAPKPPDPPEITQTTNASKLSFSFSNVENRAAQGTPVPVGYGELIVGSEVIQSTIKSFPIGQETTASFKRNPFSTDGTSTTSSTQFLESQQ